MYVVFAVTVLLLRRRLRKVDVPARRPPADLVALCGVAIVPALVTYLLVHIGQLAYMLYAAPLLLLFSGGVIESAAALMARAPFTRGRARTAILALCLVANVAIFLGPQQSLGHQVTDRDRHVASLIAQVRAMDPDRVVLVTDPEGPGSYRLAMYYLPEYPAVAVGRDWHGRAGEMFANHGGAPEYDIARFTRAGALNLPTNRRAVILDEAVVRSIGDPSRLQPYRYGPGNEEKLYFVDLMAADPPVALGPYIFVRGSDCPCLSRVPGTPTTTGGAEL
jgi:hypothetical protein